MCQKLPRFISIYVCTSLLAYCILKSCCWGSLRKWCRQFLSSRWDKSSATELFARILWPLPNQRGIQIIYGNFCACVNSEYLALFSLPLKSLRLGIGRLYNGYQSFFQHKIKTLEPYSRIFSAIFEAPWATPLSLLLTVQEFTSSGWKSMSINRENWLHTKNQALFSHTLIKRESFN